MAGQEDDWEYASEDGEDYSWEYEEDEEEAAPEIAKDKPVKEEAKPASPAVKEEAKEAPKVERRSRAAAAAERAEKEKEEKEAREAAAPAPMEKSDRNAIMEQMKRLQEGYNDLEVDLGSDFSESESTSEDDRPVRSRPSQPKAEEEEDLSDLDLLDPFGSEPVPVVQKKAPTNGHRKTGEEADEKKHRKHRKKGSRHESTFEKFRNLEQKDKNGGDGGDGDSSKKIHVRSKDPSKIARQFEKLDKGKSSNRRPSSGAGSKAPVKAPKVEVNTICKVCGKEPYVVERLVAEKSWWHKNCFRCKECNKTLTLDTYASHQGVIYCKPHQRDLFKPKAVVTDLSEEMSKKNLEFHKYNVDGDIVDRHKRQEKRMGMETIVRESKPEVLEGVVKGKSDDTKWDGLDKLDVGSKFMMFERAGEKDKEARHGSDRGAVRYGIMEKLKRLQAGEDVSDLLAEIDDEMPDEEEEEDEDPEEYGLTEIQKKAHRAEKLFDDKDSKKEKLALQRKVELKKLREKLMAGTRDNAVDSFDELNHRKVEKTKVEVRSANAKKFMDMFNNGEVPEGMNAGDRTTLEKDAELAQMRKNKRSERDYFKKMENGELKDKKSEFKEPKLLIGKLKDMNGGWMDKEEEEHSSTKNEFKMERMHAAKECKASSVLNKFKEMEQKIANGEDLDEDKPRNRPQPRRFTPPRKLGEESGSEYSDSDYSYSSDYSDSDSEDSYQNGKDAEENEYLRNVREAARAKQLRAKFEEWEAGLGEDGGYTNLVDEDGRPLETASKLKNRFENMAIAEPPPKVGKKYQVKRFK